MQEKINKYITDGMSPTILYQGSFSRVKDVFMGAIIPVEHRGKWNLYMVEYHTYYALHMPPAMPTHHTMLQEWYSAMTDYNAECDNLMREHPIRSYIILAKTEHQTITVAEIIEPAKYPNRESLEHDHPGAFPLLHLSVSKYSV
jgi:hypothetical protein